MPFHHQPDGVRTNTVLQKFKIEISHPIENGHALTDIVEILKIGHKGLGYLRGFKHN
jgi:hypothetical protein